MLEELKEEKLIEKVGGRFRLSSLIQKRLVALNKNGDSFVNASPTENKMHVVIREILEDKIFLNTDGEVVENDPSVGFDVPVDFSANSAPSPAPFPFPNDDKPIV